MSYKHIRPYYRTARRIRAPVTCLSSVGGVRRHLRGAVRGSVSRAFMTIYQAITPHFRAQEHKGKCKASEVQVLFRLPYVPWYIGV